MRKKRKLEILDDFISAYRLLIICTYGANEKNITKEEASTYLNFQESTSMLIKDYENVIQKALCERAHIAHQYL